MDGFVRDISVMVKRAEKDISAGVNKIEDAEEH